MAERQLRCGGNRRSKPRTAHQPHRRDNRGRGASTCWSTLCICAPSGSKDWPPRDARRRRGATNVWNSLGDRFVTAAIAISTFGFLDLAILAPTRVYYAMAADDCFFLPARHAASDISHAGPCHRGPDRMVVPPRSQRELRTPAQLRRVCRLDFLRTDSRDGLRVPPHVAHP